MKSLRLIILLAVLTTATTSCEEKVKLIKVSTQYGDMLLYLYDATPKHKENFFKLAQEGFYNGTTFHRVIPGFVIQGGDPNSKDDDPNNDGMGGPDYKIDAEIKPELKHKYGAIGSARDNNPAMASNGSQYYIVVNKNGTHQLDGKYTVFGEVVHGMEVAEKIAAVQKDMRDRPLENVPMEVSIVEMKPSKVEKEYGYKIPDLQAM